MKIDADTLPLDEVEIRADSTGQMMTVVGVVGVVASLFLLSLDAPSTPLILSILFLVLGIWRTKNPFVTFRHDHFETKMALAAGHHKLLYSEVVQIETTSKQVMSIHYREHNSDTDAAPKRVKIPLKALKEPERLRCINEFRARLPESLFVES